MYSAKPVQPGADVSADEKKSDGDSANGEKGWLEQVKEFAGQIVLGITGLGYVAGLLIVRGFAAGLGVSVSDLDLTTQDYLALAGVNALLMILAGMLSTGLIVVAAYAVLVRRRKLLLVWTLPFAFGTMLILFGAMPFPLAFGWRALFAATGAVVIVGIVALSAILLDRSTATPETRVFIGQVWLAIGKYLWGFIVVATVVAGLLISVVLGPVAAYVWATEAKEDPEDDLSGPWTLSLTIDINEGIVIEAPNDSPTGGTVALETCVLRVAPRVLIGSDGAVRVDVEPRPFRPGSCMESES